jgi:hypothetical protein
MLSSVLRSRKAIFINIEIIRAFARYRGLLVRDDILRKEINTLNQKIDQVFSFLLGKIDAMNENNTKKRKRIGCKDYEKEEGQ